MDTNSPAFLTQSVRLVLECYTTLARNCILHLGQHNYVLSNQLVT